MKRILLKLPLLLRGCGLFHCGSLCFSASHIYQQINEACNVNVYIPTNFTNVHIMQYIRYIYIYIQFTETNHFSIFLVKLSWFTNLYVHFATQTHRFTVIEWRSKDPKCHRPSVEKGGGTSLGAFNGCYNLDPTPPPAVTVANIKVYRDSLRLFFWISWWVTAYRVVDPSDPFGYGWTENNWK